MKSLEKGGINITKNYVIHTGNPILWGYLSEDDILITSPGSPRNAYEILEGKLFENKHTEDWEAYEGGLN